MSTVILRGEEAIHYAEVHGMKLSLDANDDHPARSGLTVAAAREIQDAHAGHVWVEAHLGVNSGERVEPDPVAPGH